MSGKKLLIISPTPTHPQNAGNRIRVYNLSAALKKLGFEVHFLFVELEKGDKEAMNQYWKGKVYYFCGTGSFFPPIALSFWKRFFYSFTYSSDEREYNFHIDDWYDTNLDEFISALQKEERFDIVVVEYVFLSKAFLNFSGNVLKVLDTHDIFTNRFKVYLNNDQKPQWFSTYEKEEAKALNRADLITAIQNHEKRFFEKITHKKVIQIGHILSYCPNRKTDFDKKLLFVASQNPINIDGITFFMEKVLTKLTITYPDVELVIAGQICNVLDAGGNITLLGEFENAQQVYNEGDIVINPVRFGTGLNIKTIEALSYGKPLVTTSAGMAGLEYLRNKAFLVADTDLEFIDTLSNLMDDESWRQLLIKNAENFIEDYNQENLRELEKMLN